MDGKQVSPDLVKKVGETFESILKEACPISLCTFMVSEDKEKILNTFTVSMYLPL